MHARHDQALKSLVSAIAFRYSSFFKLRCGSVDCKDLFYGTLISQKMLDAMRKVPRHLFTPKQYRDQAYADRPLPIGHDQTISQPYIVALMTQLTRPQPHFRALDVGTGSGYQAAVLAELGVEVYSVEIIPALARQAAERLEVLGYTNIHARLGDGYHGWPEQAPFDLSDDAVDLHATVRRTKQELNTDSASAHRVCRR